MKVVRKGDHLFGAAGSTAATKKMRDWFLGPDDVKQPEADCHMIIVPPEGPVILLNHEGQNRITGPFFAIGSGADVAMGAMAAGASADEAVAIAIQLDTFSGGEITILRRA